MKSKGKLLFLLILVLSLILTSCGTAPQNECLSAKNADLVLMADSGAKPFLGTSQCEEGLLKQFKKETGHNIYVSYVGTTEEENIKLATLAKKPDAVTELDVDVFMFDSSLFASGLKDQKFVASTYVGPWIRKDIAEKIGWAPGSSHSLAEYASIMESGQLKMVAPNAQQSVPGALSFFATLGSFYGPEDTLTYEQVMNIDAINYGKKIYDHYARSADSTDQAVDLVFKDNLDGKNNLDGVIAYESSFLGPNGLNAQLEKAGKQPFVFFYFSDASIKATLTMGRVDNMSSTEKDVYSQFSKFIDEESSQTYIASTGVRPGGFGYEADPQAMNSSWGLQTDPQITLISSPVYVVANEALIAYGNYYKRPKVLDVCEDISPSMSQQRVPSGITRLQALNLANATITDPAWLATHRLTPGKNDLISYYFFSGYTSDMVVQSVGADTKQAGDRLNHFIGNDDSQNNQVLFNELGFTRSSTAIFDCATIQLNNIAANYDSKVDYYIVLMTDGENVEPPTPEAFYESWKAFNKPNVTVVGIAFGDDKSSVDSEYTSKFQGFTYKGTTESELLAAFQKVFGN